VSSTLENKSSTAHSKPSPATNPRGFPPQCPYCQKLTQKNGATHVNLIGLFGQIKLPAQRLICPNCKKSSTILKDTSLDHSGFTPAALERVVHLCVHQTFEEASETLNLFTWHVNDALLERVVSGFATQALEQVSQILETRALQPLEQVKTGHQPKITILETDGVFTLGRPEDPNETGCPGREIKMALVHSSVTSTDRFMVADHCDIDAFEPLVHGLLRHAGHRNGDVLVGVGDGGSWVQRIFEAVQAIRVLDVYHALEYVETVMIALGWDQELRLEERRLWCAGKVDGSVWLRTFDPGTASRAGWDETAIKAWAYLERFSSLEAMAYPSFRARGFPIGSGEVEGANKSVIGSRMKRSGMHWSRAGARRMSCLRAQVKSRVRVYDFHQVRLQAFHTW
jgi:hypothetical protein